VKNRYLQIKCPVTVKNTASWRGGFMGLTNTYEFLPVYQVHTDVSDAFYTQTALSQMQEADLKARTLNLNNTNSLTMKPFQYVSALSGSSLSWNTGIKLVRTDFTGTVDDPEWKYRLAGWDTDSFSAHNLTGVLAATQRSQKFKESLTLKVNLPPLNRRYETIAAVSFPYCTSLSVSTAWKLNDDDVWVYEPLSQSSSWALLDKKLTVSQSYRYNREDEHSESLSVAASGYGASVTYNMLYTTPYEYVSQNGWVAKTEKEFLPYSINMRYAMPGFTWSRLNDAITLKPSVTSSLAMDLIRPTQSNFTVSSGLTFKITEFLTITVAAESQNKVVYRYVQRYFGSDVTLPGQENIFLDLMDSFAFWNPVARQNSGFKMRSFSVNLDHNLHDWTLHSEFKISPRLIKDTGVPEYDYSPYFILSVKWNPMSSLKTTIQDNYGEFVLNPSDK
ncbi:MAG: hypothetical protein MJ178_07165, partial [Treponemataceae bacterium]|nr:hypothetical protein [Treponemataceae bacterium]